MKLKFSVKSFVCILSILLILGLLYVRGNEVAIFSAKYSEEGLDKYLSYCKSCEIIDGGEYRIKGEDPQLIFDFTKEDKEVYGVKIKLSEKVNLENVNAFFGAEKPEFSESDSLYFQSVESDVIEILSNKPFRYLRIDINEETKFEQSEIANDIDVTNVGSGKKYLYMALMAIFVSLVCAFIKPVSAFITNILTILKKYTFKVWNNRKRLYILLIFCAVEAVVSFLFEKIFVYLNGKTYMNKFHMLLYFVVMFLITLTIIFWKNIKRYAHIYYFVVLMLVGTLHVISSPPAAGVAWDDQIHYGRTAYISWGSSGKYSCSDYDVSRLYSSYFFGSGIYQREGREQWINLINSEDEIIVDTDYDVSFVYVAYIPASIGLNIGRGMGLSFSRTFMLGKWMNLLFYSFILSLSIWLLNKRGKILVALLGAIPTMVFIATTYSYDWWVASLLILSFSVIYSRIQNDKKISTKCMMISMGIFILALLPKAIYFALAFPLLFLSNKKFENPRYAKSIVILAMILLALTFVAPILMGSNANTDVRGGADVNALGQISYILSNPGKYAMDLLGFLKGYLSLDLSREYLTFFAYYGHAEYFTVCIALLFMGMVIDNNNECKKEKYSKFYKILVTVTVWGTMILVATALYISFTPVGSTTINGCQPRYILPVLFILMYTLAELKIDVSEKTKNNFFAVGTLIMLFIFMNDINELCISLY